MLESVVLGGLNLVVHQGLVIEAIMGGHGECNLYRNIEIRQS